MHHFANKRKRKNRLMQMVLPCWTKNNNNNGNKNYAGFAFLLLVACLICVFLLHSLAPITQIDHKITGDSTVSPQLPTSATDGDKPQQQQQQKKGLVDDNTKHSYAHELPLAATAPSVPPFEPHLSIIVPVLGISQEMYKSLSTVLMQVKQANNTELLLVADMTLPIAKMTKKATSASSPKAEEQAPSSSTAPNEEIWTAYKFRRLVTAFQEEQKKRGEKKLRFIPLHPNSRENRCEVSSVRPFLFFLFLSLFAFSALFALCSLLFSLSLLSLSLSLSVCVCVCVCVDGGKGG